jgi:hypothetical protein
VDSLRHARRPEIFDGLAVVHETEPCVGIASDQVALDHEGSRCGPRIIDDLDAVRLASDDGVVPDRNGHGRPGIRLVADLDAVVAGKLQRIIFDEHVAFGRVDIDTIVAWSEAAIAARRAAGILEADRVLHDAIEDVIEDLPTRCKKLDAIGRAYEMKSAHDRVRCRGVDEDARGAALDDGLLDERRIARGHILRRQRDRLARDHDSAGICAGGDEDRIAVTRRIDRLLKRRVILRDADRAGGRRWRRRRGRHTVGDRDRERTRDGLISGGIDGHRRKSHRPVAVTGGIEIERERCARIGVSDGLAVEPKLNACNRDIVERGSVQPDDPGYRRVFRRSRHRNRRRDCIGSGISPLDVQQWCLRGAALEGFGGARPRAANEKGHIIAGHPTRSVDDLLDDGREVGRTLRGTGLADRAPRRRRPGRGGVGGRAQGQIVLGGRERGGIVGVLAADHERCRLRARLVALELNIGPRDCRAVRKVDPGEAQAHFLAEIRAVVDQLQVGAVHDHRAGRTLLDIVEARDHLLLERL